MKIDRVQISNFKRIRMVEFKPEGELVVVGGQNGQGKTSVLDAIASALSGTKPKISDPVRHGADRYETIVLTDTGLEIRQYGTREGTYGLRVRAADGMEAAQPARFLEKFYSSLTFDPLAFSRQTAAQQGETLRRLLGLDWSELDAKRRELYDARTGVNREVAAIGTVEPVDPALPELPLSLADLSDALQDANRANDERRRAFWATEEMTTAVAQWEQRLQEAKEGLANATRDLASAQAALTLLPEPVDTERLSETIRNAEGTNARIQTNNERRRALAAVETRRAQSQELTERIEGIDAEKRQMITSAAFPVLGLGFDDDGGVIFNGVPFDQAAASEQIRVSAAIGLEMAPQLKVLLIRDGSLLDDDSLAELEQLARQYDAQILIERVGSEGAQIVLRDGEIVGDDLPWDDHNETQRSLSDAAAEALEAGR